MVKHEVGKKQKRKEGNTRLPTFGGCYCQQKARNGKKQILKRWRKNDICLDMVQIEPKMKGFRSEYCKGQHPNRQIYVLAVTRQENTADGHEGNYNIPLKTLKKGLKTREMVLDRKAYCC